VTGVVRQSPWLNRPPVTPSPEELAAFQELPGPGGEEAGGEFEMADRSFLPPPGEPSFQRGWDRDPATGLPVPGDPKAPPPTVPAALRAQLRDAPRAALAAAPQQIVGVFPLRLYYSVRQQAWVYPGPGGEAEVESGGPTAPDEQGSR
jgi:hypothetical protein